MEKQSEVIKVQGLPVVVAGFNWSTGVLMEKFIKTLAEKKILAAKCPKCGYTHVPPRRRCIKCNATLTDEDVMKMEFEDGSSETIPIPVCPDCFVKQMSERQFHQGEYARTL